MKVLNLELKIHSKIHDQNPGRAPGQKCCLHKLDWILKTLQPHPNWPSEEFTLERRIVLAQTLQLVIRLEFGGWQGDTEAGHPLCKFSLRGASYECDFKRMVQKNLDSGKERKIRPPSSLKRSTSEHAKDAPPGQGFANWAVVVGMNCRNYHRDQLQYVHLEIILELISRRLHLHLHLLAWFELLSRCNSYSGINFWVEPVSGVKRLVLPITLQQFVIAPWIILTHVLYFSELITKNDTCTCTCKLFK